jgi:hypothetical protein
LIATCNGDRNIAPLTPTSGNRWRLQLFTESIDKNLTVAQVKHYHLDELVLKRKDWSPGTKHGMARAVM